MKHVHFLGVDVSKKTLDITLLNEVGKLEKQSRISNDKDAITCFFDELKREYASFQFATAILCLEYTGIYAEVLLNFLAPHQIQVCIEMALQIKRSQGIQRGKNDKVDALRIAQYAYKNQQTLRFWTPTRPQLKELKALLVLRERLIRTKNQLEVPLQEGKDFINPHIQKQIKAATSGSIKALKKDIQKVDQRIDQLIHQDEALKTQFKLITSVPGIGPVIAANMIVTTNEFKSITEAKKYACYAGVAPFQYTSGTSVKGKPHVSKLANMTIKKLLHLGATSAIQHSQEMKVFYERKVEEGKHRLSVINAVRNKLINRVFACIRDQRPYEKTYKYSLA